MSIKQTKANNQKQVVSILGARLDNLLEDNYLKNLPQDLREKIKDFKNEVEQYKISSDKSQNQEINGQILDANLILNTIVDASGYTKWTLEEVTQLDKEEIEEIKDDFGISFTEEVISKYRYYRSTQHRNDVNMITVTAMPGYNQIAIDTDRAGIFIEYLVTQKEMKKEIKAYF